MSIKGCVCFCACVLFMLHFWPVFFILKGPHKCVDLDLFELQFLVADRSRFPLLNRMRRNKTNRGKSRRKQWEKSYWLRRLNSMTPRYSQSACNWAERNLSDVYSVLNKALWRAKKAQYKYPLRLFRSRHRRRSSSSTSWSQSCASGKPKTTDPCTRARMALLKTSSQVGQTTL